MCVDEYGGAQTHYSIGSFGYDPPLSLVTDNPYREAYTFFGAMPT